MVSIFPAFGSGALAGTADGGAHDEMHADDAYPEAELDAAWQEILHDEEIARAMADAADDVTAEQRFSPRDRDEGTARPSTDPDAPRPEDRTGDGDPTVIGVSVGLPGTPEAAGMATATSGFRAALGPGDDLTLNIAPDLPGEILAVHAVTETAPGGTSSGCRRR